jgi:adenylate cyclase
MESPPIERRLAAILSADVEGYSRLMHIDEEATMTTLSAHRAVVDDLIGRHRGRIANTAGDSVLAEFASVLDAVRCAIEIQEAIERANEVQTHERQMRFRLGVNVGDVMVKDGDIFGDGVNVAARLEGSSPAPTATSCAEAARFLASSTIIAAVYRLLPIRTPPKKSGTGLPTAM